MPAKAESSGPSKSWIPARASYRQLGRNDARIIQRTSETSHDLHVEDWHPKKDALHGKLTNMKSPWKHPDGSPESIKSPTWHEKLLDERRKRIAAGEARFINWKTAKADIRAKVETQ